MPTTTSPNDVKDWRLDPRLGARAKGILAVIIAFAEAEPFRRLTLRRLVASGPDGRGAVQTAIAELELRGYLRRRPDRDSYSGLQWQIFPAGDGHR